MIKIYSLLKRIGKRLALCDAAALITNHYEPFPFSVITSFSISPFFASHMVLQQGVPLTVWGQSPPFEPIQVKPGE